jgi:hypothetical protein
MAIKNFNWSFFGVCVCGKGRLLRRRVLVVIKTKVEAGGGMLEQSHGSLISRTLMLENCSVIVLVDGGKSRRVKGKVGTRTRTKQQNNEKTERMAFDF